MPEREVRLFPRAKKAKRVCANNTKAAPTRVPPKMYRFLCDDNGMYVADARASLVEEFSFERPKFADDSFDVFPPKDALALDELHIISSVNVCSDAVFPPSSVT